MDSFHAVCEKFYFEALAFLFWICCCFSFWEHCVNVEIISYHRNILTEAGCLAYKPTWKGINNMFQCCCHKLKLVVIAVGCAICKIQGLPWLWLISLHIFQTLIVQVKCFEEIINIGYAVYRIHGLPWFRSLSWYFLITSNYFFYGESLVDYFGVVINRTVSSKIEIKPF